MNATIDELTGSATFEREGASPDSPKHLTGREFSRHLKAMLADRFPRVAFRLRGSRGTGYGYYYVSWTDGPTEAEVADVTNLAESTRFDGMIDCELPTGRRSYCFRGEWFEPWARSVNLCRTISNELAARCVATYCAHYTGAVPPTGDYDNGSWSDQYPYPSPRREHNHFWSWFGIVKRIAAKDFTTDALLADGRADA